MDPACVPVCNLFKCVYVCVLVCVCMCVCVCVSVYAFAPTVPDKLTSPFRAGVNGEAIRGTVHSAASLGGVWLSAVPLRNG